jgi:hypothetical protein
MCACAGVTGSHSPQQMADTPRVKSASGTNLAIHVLLDTVIPNGIPGSSSTNTVTASSEFGSWKVHTVNI